MKNIFKSLIAGAATIALSGSMIVGLPGVASAASCYQYSPNGFKTSKTPVYNHICGTPENIGDEANFVRIRQNSNGSDIDNAHNGAYSTGPLSNACTDGTKFDVWNYIHNDADQDFNDNGNGSAVAHNVKLAMNAPLGKTQSDFTFKSTISASNAATVSDTAILNCQGQPVKMSLVKSSVHIYSKPYGNWKDLSDSAINGTTKIGSPIFGSGDEWGCWNYRVVVVYQVVVHKVSKPPVKSAGVCKAVDKDVNKSNRTVSVTVHGHTKNATIVGYKIDFGDGTVVPHKSATHQYAKAGQKHIKTYVKVKYANGKTSGWITSSDCETTITFPAKPPKTPPETPPQTPPSTPPELTPPSILPNTGPVGLAGLFLGTSGLGTLGHWFYRRRKYSRQ